MSARQSPSAEPRTPPLEEPGEEATGTEPAPQPETTPPPPPEEPPVQWIEYEPLPPPLPAHEVDDRELRAVKTAIARTFESLRAAAPGLVTDPELEGGPVGRTYGWLEAPLEAGDASATLGTLVRADMRPSPGDFVFYVRVDPLQRRGAAEIEAAFDVSAELDPGESTALHNLATEIEAHLIAFPSLRAYSLQGGWADAVGAAQHGVAIVSADGEEVLWVYAESVWAV